MDRSQLIERGRKLARLADPALNEYYHEVETAQRKLNAFLLKHDLTFRDLGLFTLFKKQIFDASTQFMRWEQQLLAQVAHTIGVEVLTYGNGAVFLAGEESPVRAVMPLYENLRNVTKLRCDKYAADYNAVLWFRSPQDLKVSFESFCIGFIQPICMKLEKIKQARLKTQKTSKAEDLWHGMGDLGQTRDAIKEELGNKLDIDPVEFQPVSRIDQFAYEIGMEEGKDVTLNVLDYLQKQD